MSVVYCAPVAAAVSVACRCMRHRCAEASVRAGRIVHMVDRRRGRWKQRSGYGSLFAVYSDIHSTRVRCETRSCSLDFVAPSPPCVPSLLCVVLLRLVRAIRLHCYYSSSSAPLSLSPLLGDRTLPRLLSLHSSDTHRRDATLTPSPSPAGTANE